LYAEVAVTKLFEFAELGFGRRDAEQKSIEIPYIYIGTASAANASGFLLVS